ncbi:MAG: glycosyltransferase family 4 protein [Verrucomicrobiota bacterium]|jgi:glycosyltransferase involved in cell wall biosynthesis|nr:glycosyltransferase family 4 protein [Verrucomicrobiota bacterium]
MQANFQDRDKEKPTISFLVPNISGTSLGFATVYARSLSAVYPVEVVGPDIWGTGVQPMYRHGFSYTAVPASRLYKPSRFWAEAAALAAAADGDILFAVKAMPQTVWVALREKARRGCPVVVCLDEWDGALMAQRSRRQRLACWARHWKHLTEENYYPLVERSLSRADVVVSTSSFLQRKFGGRLVRMGVDTAHFRPLESARRAAARRELGLSEADRVIVFGGVVRPHKGVERIVQALEALNRPEWRLLVVGPVTDTLKALQQSPGGQWVVAAGPKPAGEMPVWLGAADACILPLSTDLLAQSQVPCKVYEAMASGLAVAASAVSDLPEVLEGAGRTFSADDPAALLGILREWSEHPEIMSVLGRAARERAVGLYSLARMQDDLLRVVEDVWRGRRSAR